MTTSAPAVSRHASLAEKIRFALVGCINTAVDFGVLNILIWATVLPVYAANIISTFVAMCVSLLLNKGFVFRQGYRVKAREVLAFILVTLTGVWGVQTIVIFLLIHQFPAPLTTIAETLRHYLHSHGPNATFIVDNGAKIVATGASLVWNYIWYKKVVFAGREGKEQA